MSERDADKNANQSEHLENRRWKKVQKKFLQLIKLDAIISNEMKVKFPVAP